MGAGHTWGAAVGKAAENERVKLEATFLNSIAVGLVLTGVLIPCLVIYRHPELLTYALAGNFTQILTPRRVASGVGVIISLCAGIYLHRWALKELTKIQD